MYMALLSFLVPCIAVLLYIISTHKTTTTSTTSATTIPTTPFIPQLDNLNPCTPNNLKNFLNRPSNTTTPLGLTVFCFDSLNSTHSSMHVYVNATEDVPRSTHIIPGSFHNNKFSIPSVANFNFDDHLTRQILPFFSNENRPSPSTPWTPTFQHSFFDGSGNALDETLPFRENEIFLLYQGGRFIWPGISPGFKRRIPIDNKSVLTLHTLSVVPLVYEVEEQFLTDVSFISSPVSPSRLLSTNPPTLHRMRAITLNRPLALS